MESRRAWVVVWATFVCLAVIFGVSYSFAAFFENFANEFAAQRADVAEMTAEELRDDNPLPRVGKHDGTVSEAIRVIPARAMRH